MLLQNIKDNLVNGLIGEVTKCSAKSVTVHFKQLQRKETFVKKLFTRYGHST